MKYKKIILSGIVVFAAALAMTAAVKESGGKEIFELERPQAEEDSIIQPIEVLLEGEAEPFNVNLEIMPRAYKQEQIDIMFENAYQEILSQMCGENENLSHVSKQLYLPMSLDEYAVSIAWYSSESNVVSCDGKVYNAEFAEDEKREVTLTLYMTYQQYQWEQDIYITVTAPKQLSRSDMENGVKNHLQAVQEAAQEAEILYLPKTIYGKKAAYKTVQEKVPIEALIGLMFAACVALRLRSVEQKRQAQRQRKEQMQYDYAEIISKLTLLAGAGMTIRRAWEKISKDYQSTLDNANKRFAYDEMVRTCQELETGISEKSAYEHFGRRCNIKEYLKLSSILAQNVTKGSQDILRLLEEESNLAFEEHKNLARKKGEEAGTKLLIPMFIMLIIVMVIVMFPAMTSFVL